MYQLYKYNNRKASNYRKQFVPKYSKEELENAKDHVSSIRLAQMERQERMIIHRR